MKSLKSLYQSGEVPRDLSRCLEHSFDAGRPDRRRHFYQRYAISLTREKLPETT